MGFVRNLMSTLFILLVATVLIFPNLQEKLHSMSKYDMDVTIQTSIQKSIEQAMMKEKEWLKRGLREAEIALKGQHSKDEKWNREQTVVWHKFALQSYENFARAYDRLITQYKQWAGKAFDPDSVLKRWPGILLNGNMSERKMLYMTDKKGNPLQVQPDSIMKMPNRSAEDRFHKLIRDIHVHCLNRRRLGYMRDGGWDVCSSGPFRPKQNDCLVYSFGINNDFTFDDAMADIYGCEVKCFDPSMGVATHSRSKRVYFYNLGISDKNEYDHKRNWTLKTLDTIIKENGHSDKIITSLKIDIDGPERDVLRQIVKTDVLKNVMQFYFEIHVYEYTKAMLYDLYTHMYEVEKLGFRRFHYHRNWHCVRKSNITGIIRSMCHEFFYVNINFL